jgi:hypothetical protein
MKKAFVILMMVSGSLWAKAQSAALGIDSTTAANHAAIAKTLRSTAYKSLQGFAIGGTLTSAQLNVVCQMFLFQADAFNVNTGKVDSTNNYIKITYP